MADPCVNARRTRRITARQSHLPKIRDDRKSVDRHEQIGLRYGSRSSTIGPASSRLKRKPASSRTARRQAADRVLMCTGFWRPPAKSPSVRCREPRACASCLPHQGRELWLLDCARLCPYYWPKKGNHLRSSRRRSCRWEWSESNEQDHEKRNKRPPGCSRPQCGPVPQCPSSDGAAELAATFIRANCPDREELRSHCGRSRQ